MLRRVDILATKQISTYKFSLRYGANLLIPKARVEFYSEIVLGIVMFFVSTIRSLAITDAKI